MRSWSWTLLLAVGCASAPERVDPTWYADIKPVIDERCAGCHTDGGAGPFALDNLESFGTFAEVALDAVESGRMPPYLADTTCRSYADDITMPADEIDTLRAWIDGGLKAGDPADEVPFEREAVQFDPTHTAGIKNTYLANASLDDDYRCFELDMDFETDMYMRASDVTPGSGQVHHVLVYAVDSDFQQTIDDLEDGEEGEGYSCFSGPIPTDDALDDGLPVQLAAWVPGIVPTRLPPGMAIRIEAGSRIVMQVHYSAVAGEPDPDDTLVNLELSSEEPDFLLTTRPGAVIELDIPAGDPSAVNTAQFTNYRADNLVIVGVSTHMHLLGKQQIATLIHSDGSQECLLDVPDWDFNWQRAYTIDGAEPAVLAPGDTLEVSCIYDNSADNQPVVDGVQLEPRDVHWGDGTLDEMCILFFTTMEPFTPSAPIDAGACWGTESCMADCDGDPVQCALDCEQADFACAACVLEEVNECAWESCELQALTSLECMIDCLTSTAILGGSTGQCMHTECAPQYDALMACGAADVAAGECDDRLVGCGLNLSR